MFKSVLIVAVIIAAAGSVFYFKNHAPADTADNQSPTPTAVLTVVNNSVNVKDPTGVAFKEVPNGSLAVKEGSVVKTSLTGRAIIESANQTTVVDKNSEFTLVTQEENKTKIKLDSGNLWATVKKVLGKDEYYQIETPNAVATVRGTSFWVSYINNKTVVLVSESKVSVQSIDPNTKKPIGDEVIIQQGQKGSVTTGGTPKAESITETDKKSEWYQFNQKGSPSPTPKPSPTPTKVPTKSPTPTASPKPTAIQTPVPTPTPTPIPKATIAPTPTPTPTPTPAPAEPTLKSVVPNILSMNSDSKDFFINGTKLTGAKQVLVGQTSIKFFASGSETIVGTADQVGPGVYDVSVVVSTGAKLTLSKALTIR
ncbi:FecR family protein [Candidatus Parcubacteria bacterium]|nr:FecR family protein [Candidatus Parcubacteria bacterium]